MMEYHGFTALDTNQKVKGLEKLKGRGKEWASTSVCLWIRCTRLLIGCLQIFFWNHASLLDQRQRWRKSSPVTKNCVNRVGPPTDYSNPCFAPYTLTREKPSGNTSDGTYEKASITFVAAHSAQSPRKRS
jgi:hypothetical protein